MEKKRITWFDYVIVGGGPCGLAFAQCCCELGKKVIVIEKESSIGGCHRVNRATLNDEKKQYYFTEHGPRVYSSTYRVFQQLLKNMNYKFSDLFVPYNFQLAKVGNETIQSVLKWNEALELFKSFVQLTINTMHGKDISMKTYMEKRNFSYKTRDMIERICRLTDGGESSRYTLNKFLNLFNQQFFYSLYQPKTPNDDGLFKIWKQYLESKSVEFLTETKVTELLVQNAEAKGVNVTSKTTQTIFGNNIVLAIPPSNILEIIELSTQDIQNSFMENNLFKTWVKSTRYLDYISITFHFTDKLDLPKVYGFPKSDWGLAFIILSDYMTNIEPQSKTVISTVITFSDSKSKNNNKTANQCSETELIVEAYNQLSEAFPNLPLDNYIGILAPGTYKSAGKWVSSDTAFISVPNGGYLPMESKNIKNLYNVGTHNGASEYQFTSLESAVTNAVSLAHRLLPETKNMYTITSSTTVTEVSRAVIVIVIIAIIITF